MDSCVSRVALAVLLACLAVSPARAAKTASAEKFETPPQMRAASVLPKAVLSGPGYTVAPEVKNDGYLNTYALRSRFGDFTVVSTALLYTRIAEIAAMEKMSQVEGTSAFGNNLVGKGEQTVRGAVGLVTHPVDTVGGALSGVGKLFVRAHEQLVESNPSKYEGNKFQNLIGYSQVKRDYAKQFGVDPYSTNQVLQDKLSALAEAGYAGSITGSALQALIPGGVGIAVSSVGGTALLGDIDLTVPPADLRRQNRESLLKQGVPGSAARLFINNPLFTPSQQTVIVHSLAAMPHAEDKEAFVEFAAGTQDQDLALFRQRMAQMYAGYDKNVSKVERFVSLGRFIGGRTESGALVLAFPLDHLVCTSTNADIIEDFAEHAKGMSADGVELWLTGTATPATRALLKRLKWKLHESASEKLLGLPY